VDTRAKPSVFKYLELADRFVRVGVVEPCEFAHKIEPGTTRSQYRREVILACMEDFRRDLPAKLEALHPGAPQGAEDLLYQLCVSVNPELEIHAVSLRAEQGEARQEEASAGSAQPRSADTALRQLRRRARGLQERLEERVVGQAEAIARASAAVRRAAAGLAEEGRPLATMLFVGRTGTGKTELARAMAEEIFGGERSLLRIDCSEYALAHEYSKLVGSPPGYVGYEEGGLFTTAMSDEPRRVVLFDEIEKAHPRMHHLLLQVLEDGRLTDGQGKTARFDQSLIVLTSNAGAQEIEAAGERLGFGDGGTSCDEQDELALRALRDGFAPEFLGRLDETIVFRELDLAAARAVARRQLALLSRRVRRRGLKLCFSGAVADWIARRGFRPESGAREIRRVVRREVEAELAEKLLAHGSQRGTRVEVCVRRGKLQFDL